VEAVVGGGWRRWRWRDGRVRISVNIGNVDSRPETLAEGPTMTRLAILLCVAGTLAGAQTPPPQPRPAGPPVQGAEEDIPLVDRFDLNGNKVLERSERDSARAYLVAHPELRTPPRGRRLTRVGTPGPRLTERDVKLFPDSVPLYDGATLRTLFIDFEHPDWEAELEAFWHTDVEVPATLRVDGRTYRDVGLSFRGNNSFTSVPAGLKRPFSLTVDFLHDQHLLGYRELNLLNANQDPTFLRSVVFLDIARRYIPSPRANFVRVVVNGESWGVYVNQETFSNEFARERFGERAATRWKSPNNSVGGGLGYLGDSIAPYRRWYEQKGKDDTLAWRALVNATRVLHETPPERLEEASAAVLDLDEVLRYLALDVALANQDGYWKDGSDFNLHLGTDGRLSILFHDVNEGLRSTGRAGGPGAQPDPLVALDDSNKALRHRLLAVPTLRDRYLAYVGDIAERWLDWRTLGPLVEGYRDLIADDVARDTRKHDTLEAFEVGILGAADGALTPTTIRGFAELRRAALLAHPEVVRVRGR
jgi:hypothetical protein